MRFVWKIMKIHSVIETWSQDWKNLGSTKTVTLQFYVVVEYYSIIVSDIIYGGPSHDGPNEK